MQELPPEIQALIVLLSQLLFVYLRTVNVKAIAESNMALSLLSGIAIGFTGLLSLSIGITSILNLQILPVVSYLVGGSIGTFLAMRKKIHIPEFFVSGKMISLLTTLKL